MYEDKKGGTYFKTKVSDEPCFIKDKNKTGNTVPGEKTKYNCRVLLQIQSGKVVDVPLLLIID